MIVLCPKCHSPVDVAHEHTLNRSISGSARCGGHDCMSWHGPLDFEWFYDTLNDRVTTRGRNHEYTYYQCEVDLMIADRDVQGGDDTVYVVVKGTGADFHIVQIFSQFAPANEVTRRDVECRVQDFECFGKPAGNRHFKAFVISVGVGEQYRIVDITADKKRATQIATSIRGTMSVHCVTPSRVSFQDVRYHKWFVNFESSDRRFYHVDYFCRRVPLYDGEGVAPMMTHRRRYNNSLPHRLEIAAVNECDAERIAEEMNRRYNTPESAADLEYNVDYELERVNGQWEIKACLLEAAGVQ